MSLKLKVPWNLDLLTVNYDTLNDVICELRNCSPHVQREDGNVVVKDFFEQSNRVPDVIRYCVRAGRGDDERYRICNNRHIVRCADTAPRPRPYPGSIVLLLESPHVNEYEDTHDISGGIGDPRVPAYCGGKTDRGIDVCLGTVLLHTQVETGLVVPGCPVIISNPIQFQTSLYAIHRNELDGGKWTRLRNEVWKTLWGVESGYIQQCFLARLAGYDPRVIINACTSNLTERVTSTVQGWLNERGLGTPLFSAYHPSFWRNLRPKHIDRTNSSDAGNS